MRWRWPEVKSTSPCLAAISPLRLFATVRSRPLASARARWRAGPGRGSDGLPFALLRVPCDARVPGLWPNSLRSLRSNRRPQVRARSALRARPGTLRFSAAPIRPAQAPPAALLAPGSVADISHASGVEARARSAHRDLTRCACSTTANAASGRSCASFDRLRTTGLLRAAQGSRSVAETASPKRRALPGCLVAAPLPTWHMVKGIKEPTADDRTAGAFHAPRVAQSAGEH